MFGRMLIAATCIAATGATVWHTQRRHALNAAQAEKFDVAALPLQLDQWTGTSREVDDKLFRHAGALTMIQRSYEDDRGNQASVHLATYPMVEGTPAHHPQVCYPSAGWTIVNDDWQTDDHNRRYRQMRVERDGAAASITYWYQVGDDVGSSRDEIRRIVQQLQWQGKPWPPRVKVMIHVPITSSDADAKAAVEELGAKIYDWIKTQS
jgi:EpsI family protein